MKKILTMIISAMLLSLNGCSSVNSACRSAKRTLKIARIDIDSSGGSYYRDEIASFNKSTEDCEVELVQYSVEGDDSYMTAAFGLLSRDIESGSIPDIIIAPGYRMKELEKTGLFTDTAKLMREYGGLKPGELFTNVYSSLEENGRIPLLYNRFIIDTAAVKTRLMDARYENWTFSDAIAAYESISEGGHFISLTSANENIDSYFLKNMLSSCVENGSFRNGTELSEVLGFLSDVHENTYQMTADERFSEYISSSEGLAAGNTLVGTLPIRGINSNYCYFSSVRFGGEPVTLVGYPSSGGCGAYVTVPEMIGLTEACTDKQTAWRFVCKLFEDETQCSISLSGEGLPVTASAADKLLRMSAYEQNSINIRQNLPDGTPASIDENSAVQLLDYISSVDIDPFRDPQMEDIFYEEAAYVLSGERTTEECADILESRLSVYISENE